MEWINVKHNMPKKGQLVIVLYDNNTVDNGYFQGGKWITFENKGKVVAWLPIKMPSHEAYQELIERSEKSLDKTIRTGEVGEWG